jgi:hypothetical protein
VTSKIRSLRSPLIKDDEKRLIIGSIGRNLNWFLVWEFLEEFLEKGYTRKSTENRVARCRNMFWGNLKVSRCFTKRIIWGEFKFVVFWWFGRGSTWVV